MEDLSAFAGNAEIYAAANVKPLQDSPLRGKVFYFLGSSVTLGETSFHESAADFIAKRNSCICYKNAVSGTTLADLDDGSYVRRLVSDAREISPDLFICQLSTNDAARAPLGDLNDALEGIGHAERNFSCSGEICGVRARKRGGRGDAGALADVCKTTSGAVGFVIGHARARFGCPVAFYSNAYFESEVYAETVKLMHKIARRAGVFFLDLYSDEEFNRISEERRTLYMHDQVHPLRAGYLEWWTPRFETFLRKMLRG